jgi:hypothetical protein
MIKIFNCCFIHHNAHHDNIIQKISSIKTFAIYKKKKKIVTDKALIPTDTAMTYITCDFCFLFCSRIRYLKSKTTKVGPLIWTSH